MSLELTDGAPPRRHEHRHRPLRRARALRADRHGLPSISRRAIRGSCSRAARQRRHRAGPRALERRLARPSGPRALPVMVRATLTSSSSPASSDRDLAAPSDRGLSTAPRNFDVHRPPIHPRWLRYSFLARQQVWLRRKASPSGRLGTQLGTNLRGAVLSARHNRWPARTDPPAARAISAGPGRSSVGIAAAISFLRNHNATNEEEHIMTKRNNTQHTASATRPRSSSSISRPAGAPRAAARTRRARAATAPARALATPGRSLISGTCSGPRSN